MQDNLKDILSHLSQEVDQETLLAYLQGQLSAEKQHELEKSLVDNPFASDALEGLRDISDKKQLNHAIELLNRDLRKKIETRKKRRSKLKIPDQSNMAIVILILLLLVVICFLVIKKGEG